MRDNIEGVWLGGCQREGKEVLDLESRALLFLSINCCLDLSNFLLSCAGQSGAKRSQKEDGEQKMDQVQVGGRN